MNKLFKKIGVAFVGIAMSIGVGVAIGSNTKAERVEAADKTVSWTATAANNLGSQISSAGNTATGSVSLTGDATYSLNYTRRLVNLKSGKSDNISWQGSTWIQLGSSNSLESLEFATSAISGTIKSVSVTTATAGTHKLTIDVGGTKYLNSESLTTYSNTASATNPSPSNCVKTGTGSSSGAITITIASSATTTNKAMLIRSVSITYAESGKTLTSIAVKTAPTKVTYYEGQTFNPAGLVITGTYSDESTEDFSYADHSGDFTFTPSTSTALTTSDTSVTIGYGGKTCSQAITVNSDVLNSVTVSGSMSTTAYTTNDSWDKTGLVVTANYTGQGNVIVTSSATFNYYKDSSMTQEVATPNDLGASASSQTIYIKATFSGVSNTTGYSQTVTVSEAPKIATYTISGTNASPTVTPSGLVPTGTTATWSNTYTGSNIGQDTNGNSQTLTISGFSKGTIITGIKLYMHSNQSAGAGYASYQVGSGSETALVGTIGSATTFNKWGDNTSYGTTWRDVTLGTSYSINVPASSTFKIKIACVTTNSLYCTGFTINYAYANPTFTVAPLSHSIFTGELAESTVTVANFDTDPTLEYAITSGASYISDVEIGSYSDHVATVLIEADSTNFGTAVVRIRDKNNPTTYYADITVEVKEIPTYEIELSISTDTGSEYGYVGDAVTVSVTTSRLQGTGINWSVISGSVDPSTIVYDNTGYTADANASGTLTIKAVDNGNAENYATASVTIVKALNAVMAPSETPHSSELTFTGKYSENGEKVDGEASDIWTVTSDGTESTWDSANGIHFGTNSASVQYVQLATSEIATGTNDTIKSIVVNTQDRATTKGSLTVTVGGVNFKHEGNTSVTVTGGAADYTFTGNGTGEIVVKVDRGSSEEKAIYVKSVTVNYVTTGAASDIANADNMHLGQKAVIDYAVDFNTDLEAICVAYGSTNPDDLSDAWSDLIDQFNNWFNNGAKSLTTDEIAYAKSLFAHASSVDRNVTPSADDLQHMLAKYDWIVGHYELTDFLNDDPGVNREAVRSSIRIKISSIFNSENSNSVLIITIISVVSAAAIGGYFLLRKKKEI